MILFRTCPPGTAFYWESSDQPAGRWHGDGEGPVQYLATSPDAAWAEFLRHEAITDPDELAGIQRALWAIDVDVVPADLATPRLSRRVMRGPEATYATCQAEARRLRRRDGRRRRRTADAIGLRAPSAAVDRTTSSGHRTDGGLVPGPSLGEETIVLFGPRPRDPGWFGCAVGRPSVSQLCRVRDL